MEDYFYENYLENFALNNCETLNNTYEAEDKACRYALNDDELSIKAQCSFNDSVILLHHSNLLIGAESNADNKAKYELKLLCFLNSLIILMNLLTNFSRSFGSSCCRIFVRHQKLILLKCSVNFVKLGLLSSFCSCTHKINSAESKKENYKNSNIMPLLIVSNCSTQNPNSRKKNI